MPSLKMDWSWGNQHAWCRWPLRSPELAPCDFFLWGYIKECVHLTSTHDLYQSLGIQVTTVIVSPTKNEVWVEFNYPPCELQSTYPSLWAARKTDSFSIDWCCSEVLSTSYLKFFLVPLYYQGIQKVSTIWL
jgi:hypothetical protein